jgi:hypothetical protein
MADVTEDTNSSDSGVNFRALPVTISFVSKCTNVNEYSSQELAEDRGSFTTRSFANMSSLTCTQDNEDSSQVSETDFEENESDSSSSYEISSKDLDYDFLYK